MDESFEPEVNEVYFNGELVGTLTGDNQVWKFNDKFSIPIEKVKFPSEPGETADNEVGIVIDAANKDVPLSGGGTGCQVWATEIDWAALRFDAAQPVFLMAGLFGSTSSLDNSGYADKIKQDAGIYAKTFGHSLIGGIGACDSVSLPAITSHANSLIDQFVEEGGRIAESEFHLTGHSMGGLDGRMILKVLDEAEEPIKIKVGKMSGQDVFKEMKINSLLTHGTPHLGSVVADYKVAGNPGVYINDACELTTETWRNTNNVLLNTTFGTKIATIGADADFNPVNDPDNPLSADEIAGNSFGNLKDVNLFYKLLRDFQKIALEYSLAPGNEPFPHLFEAKVTFYEDPDAPNLNDTLVTVKSAHGIAGTPLTFAGSNGKNHGTIIGPSVQNESIPLGQSALGWGELK